MGLSETQIMHIRTDLQHDAGLFEDPHAYMSGVEATLAAVQRQLASRARGLRAVARSGQ